MGSIRTMHATVRYAPASCCVPAGATLIAVVHRYSCTLVIADPGNGAKRGRTRPEPLKQMMWMGWGKLDQSSVQLCVSRSLTSALLYADSQCSLPFGCGVRSTSTTSSCPLPSTAPGPRGTRTSTTARGKHYRLVLDRDSTESLAWATLLLLA